MESKPDIKEKEKVVPPSDLVPSAPDYAEIRRPQLPLNPNVAIPLTFTPTTPVRVIPAIEVETIVTTPRQEQPIRRGSDVFGTPLSSPTPARNPSDIERPRTRSSNAPLFTGVLPLPTRNRKPKVIRPKAGMASATNADDIEVVDDGEQEEVEVPKPKRTFPLPAAQPSYMRVRRFSAGDRREPKVELSEQVMNFMMAREEARERAGYGPREDDQESDISVEMGPSGKVHGVGKVITHLVKPALAMNKTSPLTQAEVDKNLRHLSKVKASAISHAIYEEDAVTRLSALMLTLAQEIEKVKSDSKISANAAVEKTGEIKPNAYITYPEEEAAPDLYMEAVRSMSKAVKVIERSCKFEEVPYDFLLEVCMESNKIAANFGLTQGQQMRLIMSYIPTTSNQYAALERAGTLEGIFKLASTCSTRISTRAELDAQINAWRLDNSEYSKLVASIDTLVALLERQEGKPSAQINKVLLYQKVIQRVKAVTSLPAMVGKGLDEAFIRLNNETDPVELYKILLVPLKGFVGWHDRRRAPGQVKQVNLPQSAPPTWLPAPQVNQTQAAQAQNTGAVPKKKGNKNPRYKGKKPRDDGQRKPQTNQTGKNGGQTSQTKPAQVKRPFNSFVPIWPEGKQYLSKSGNQLSRELEAHFEGYCFKCGHSSHSAEACRKYPEKTTVMTICQHCRQGFHLECKSRVMYAKRQQEAMVKAIQDGFAGMLRMPPQVQYMYPPPPPMQVQPLALATLAGQAYQVKEESDSD